MWCMSAATLCCQLFAVGKLYPIKDFDRNVATQKGLTPPEGIPLRQEYPNKRKSYVQTVACKRLKKPVFADDIAAVFEAAN